MFRNAVKGIGQAIKEHTTEKTIDDLKAEGKKRVRVVSSERVMEIIQAIVDDTISSEVGEITKRDRDRIVTDAQERFSRVLKMQQDLEQRADELRETLHAAELERDRLRADKALLETQLEAAHRVDGEADATARLSREIARVRETVERSARTPADIDEAALGRVVERLAARESQTARRLATDLEDLRSRIDASNRDSAGARDAAVERAMQRFKEHQAQADAQIAARFERETRVVAERLAELRDAKGRASASDEAIARVESRLAAVERTSNEIADRVAKAVAEKIATRDADVAEASARALATIERTSSEVGERVAKAASEKITARDADMSSRLAVELAAIESRIGDVERAATDAAERAMKSVSKVVVERVDAREAAAVLEAAQTNEILRRLQQASEEARHGVATEVASLRESLDDSRTMALSVQAEQFRDLERRVLDHAAEETAATHRALERLVERTAAIDGALQSLHGGVSTGFERAVAAATTPSSAVTDQIAELRVETAQAVQAAMSAARTADAQTALASRLEAAMTELRGEFMALTARSIDSAQRQHDAMLALKDQVAQSAAVQASTLHADFKDALEHALDKIERVMRSATAKPIETTVEATDVLLAKIFDSPDSELTSNLDQLDVEQRRSTHGIEKSVGRLKKMSGGLAASRSD